MLKLHQDYCVGEKKVAEMLNIYIEEAHAINEWRLPESVVEKSGEVSQISTHQNIQDRLSAAKHFFKNRVLSPSNSSSKNSSTSTSSGFQLVVDSMEGNVVDRYDAWPERLYIIIDGVVVYRGGEGPFGYKINEVKDWLENRYGNRD